jgi:hypothetical protein
MPPREEFFKRELVEELRRVEALMRKEPSVEKKIYYFSGAYGITNRTYRYAFSREVLIADIILQNTYNMLKERLQLIKSGDRNVTPEEVIFDKICDGLRDLASSFESGKDIIEPLGTIVASGFAATGPGNYLREKGEINL